MVRIHHCWWPDQHAICSWDEWVYGRLADRSRMACMGRLVCNGMCCTRIIDVVVWNGEREVMKQFATSLMAIDPRDGELKCWCGPNVPGNSVKEAQDYCNNNGLGYLKIDGLLICEIPWSVAEKATILYAPERDN